MAGKVHSCCGLLHFCFSLPPGQDRDRTGLAGELGATAGGLPTSGLRWQPPLPGVLE